MAASILSESRRPSTARLVPQFNGHITGRDHRVEQIADDGVQRSEGRSRVAVVVARRLSRGVVLGRS